jgi:hypothetical protein
MDEVFAEITLPGSVCFPDFFQGLLLAHGEQLYLRRFAVGFDCRKVQQIADFSQVFRDSNHVLVRLLRYTRLNSVRVMVSPDVKNEGKICPSTLPSSCHSR